MSITEGLAANRAAYRRLFADKEKKEDTAAGPPEPANTEEYRFAPSQAPAAQTPVYRLRTAPESISREGPRPGAEGDELLDRLLLRLEREGRRGSQELGEA